MKSETAIVEVKAKPHSGYKDGAGLWPQKVGPVFFLRCVRSAA